MKNVTNESPRAPLHGRLQFASSFVHTRDIKNKYVLDIGCGYGWFEVFAKKIGVRSIIGMELSDEDLRTAKQSIHDKNIQFRVGSAIKLPFRDCLFDTVISWEVLEHIPEGTESTMFSEISRVLKRGGICYLSTPHRSFIGTLMDPAYWFIGHRHYHVSAIASFARKADMNVDHIRCAGGLWEILWMLNLYISKWVFRRKPFFIEYFERRLDAEYRNIDGFTNIYCRFQKL
jgi:ubiquinone/menaquinone biosynthesis C-methylase UbiE